LPRKTNKKLPVPEPVLLERLLEASKRFKFTVMETITELEENDMKRTGNLSPGFRNRSITWNTRPCGKG
jgi:hypothetical protein